MSEEFTSHFVVFTAFVQLTVAFNFGLLYIERKSSTVKFRDMFHEGFLFLIGYFLRAAGSEKQRYRENNATQDEREAYFYVRDMQTELTIKENNIIRFKFLQPLGMVYGLLGIIQLFSLCMFDYGVFYVDFFLVSGQITFLYGLIILIWSLCKKGNNPHVLTVTFIYVLGIFVCYCLVEADCIFHYITENEISCWVHCLLILSYFPFAYFILFLTWHYAKRFPVLVKLVKGTKKLHRLMDEKRERSH